MIFFLFTLIIAGECKRLFLYNTEKDLNKLRSKFIFSYWKIFFRDLNLIACILFRVWWVLWSIFQNWNKRILWQMSPTLQVEASSGSSKVKINAPYVFDQRVYTKKKKIWLISVYSNLGKHGAKLEVNCETLCLIGMGASLCNCNRSIFVG